MNQSRTQALEKWLATGPRQMGEVLIQPGPGNYSLCHVADAERENLQVETAAEAARALALATATGEYRPLKTAPNLRRGWRLVLGSAAEVRQALDLLYPAMLGVLFDHEHGALPVVPLRATLGRQSGMYAVTRRLTDAQAQGLIGDFCRSDGGCLKTILWKISPEVTVETLPPEKFDAARGQAPAQLAPPFPMLCQEACNLLVAKAREVVKAAAVEPASASL